MFLCILAHKKWYRQVQTLFGHSLQNICYYFRTILRTCVAFAANMIKPHPTYNEDAANQYPNPKRSSILGSVCYFEI